MTIQSPRVRWTGAAIVGLALCALLVSVTAAGVFRASRPQIAIALAPYDARARAGLAQQSISTGRVPSAELVRQAQTQAREAYRRDPTAIAAVRVSGFLADLQRRRQHAQRLFRYAERLSRRDMLTELWLIEDRVAANDIPGALHHYDTIMRSSEEVRSILYPVLSNATGTPEVARELNRLLLTKPNWWRNFLTFYLGAYNDSGALETVFRGTLDWSDEEDRELATNLLQRLAGAGRYDLAWNAYADLLGPSAEPAALLRDGDFRGERRLPPFDWSFAEDGELNPDRRLRDGSDDEFVLYVPLGSPIAGDSARQVLRLPPGRYQMRAQVGNVPEDALRRPAMQIDCARQPARRLVAADFPVAPAEGRAMVVEFNVPQGCAHQSLALHVKGSLDRTTSDWAWIGSISLRRL